MLLLLFLSFLFSCFWFLGGQNLNKTAWQLEVMLWIKPRGTQAATALLLQTTACHANS